MSTSRVIVALIGVVLIILGIVRHFAAFGLTRVHHISIWLVVIGAIVLLVGFLMTRQRRPALG